MGIKRLKKEEKELLRQKHGSMSDFKIQNLERFMNCKKQIEVVDG